MERYAEALAYQRQYAADVLPGVLERLGTTPEALEEAAQRWSGAIAERLAAGDPDPLLRFSRVLSRVEGRLRATHPPVSTIRPLEGLDRVEAAPAVSTPAPRMKPLEPEPSDGDAAPAVAVPTYLRAKAPGAPLPPAPVAPAAVAAPAPVVAAPEREEIPAHIRAAAGQRASTTLSIEEEERKKKKLATLPFAVAKPPDGAAPARTAGPGQAPVPFERFARYRWEVQRGTPMHEAAQRLGLTLAQVTDGERYWGARIQAEAAVKHAFESTWSDLSAHAQSGPRNT